MRRREDHPLTKHTLNLYEGDYPWLQAQYGSRLGAAKVIRDLVRGHIIKIKADATAKLNLKDLDIAL